ncbi:MAG: DUF3604 domain-containing protein [Deltaproteobacteria bacterium]
MLKKVLLALALVSALAFAGLFVLGKGYFAESMTAGTPEAKVRAASIVAAREEAVAKTAVALGVEAPKQILFGDLHVHTTFSFDAFQMSLPTAGGTGAYPVADACDFARHCAALDFWSINDHALSLTPQRWEETVAAIRQCQDIGGDTNPDMVSYLGWEWTQVGTEPSNHWGHKNVILRGLEASQIPTRPITAGTPPGLPPISETAPPALLMGLLAIAEADSGGPELARYMTELSGVPECPTGVAVRELPVDCREVAATPTELFTKLDDWNVDTLVIPHGTAWGFYTPLGSSWDKQLTNEQHNPRWQRLIEVYSGHGNSEEYRDWQEVLLGEGGAKACPPPTKDFTPSCWRAGVIIEQRCLAAGNSAQECAEKAAVARNHFIYAPLNGGFSTIPGTQISDWQDAGQCKDCFLPAFNYRPKSTAQYIMALNRPENDEGKDRFRFGFLAASDNHSARPGTGYKPVSRQEFTEARFGNFVDTQLGKRDTRAPDDDSVAIEIGEIIIPFANFETERQASFFLNGGLTAVHSSGRDRQAIWDAMQRREVYGTSGPRILLWFDLLNGPEGAMLPMGAETRLSQNPEFRVRAAGSFRQKPGCPPDAIASMAAGRLERLCQGECYSPTDQRNAINRIEIVRVRPQRHIDEHIADLIEDPWKTLPCPAGTEGCDVTFRDDDFLGSGRDVLYYARAIEEPTPTVGANPLHCQSSDTESCASVSPCFDRPWDDNCLADAEHRAWSSPIFIDQP